MLPVARVGDNHACPLSGTNVIVTGGSATADGRPIARVGDTCACGAIIVMGSSIATLDNRPVAYLGSKTQCEKCPGGAIVMGSPTATVMP